MRKIFSWVICLLPSLAWAQAAPVVVAPLEKVATYPSYQASATAFSEHRALLKAEIFSQVAEVLVKEGDQVEAGAALLRFNCADEPFDVDILKATEAKTSVELEFAKWQQAQNETLTAQALSSLEKAKSLETKVSTLTHQLQITESEREKAQNQLRKCTIVAPFQGTVAARHVMVGDLANPGDPTLEIVDAEHLYLLANVQPDWVAHLVAAKAPYFSDLLGKYAVMLDSVVPALHPVTGLQTVRLNFHSGAQPLTGARGQLRWEDVQPHLSERYIEQRGEHYGYFSVTPEGTAHFVSLKGVIEGQSAPLPHVEGNIVISGSGQLQEAMPVEVIEAP